MARLARRQQTAGAKRVAEALSILRALSVPRALQNERSALTLLALLGMTPRKRWVNTTAPMLGITEMMNHVKEHFGKEYAPNTRETVRRFTVHQFVHLGLVVANPDNPERPVNSVTKSYLRC